MAPWTPTFLESVAFGKACGSFRHVFHGGFVDPGTEEDASDGDELEQLFPAEVIPVGGDHFMPSLQLRNGIPFGVVLLKGGQVFQDGLFSDIISRGKLEALNDEDALFLFPGIVTVNEGHLLGDLQREAEENRNIDGEGQKASDPGGGTLIFGHFHPRFLQFLRCTVHDGQWQVVNLRETDRIRKAVPPLGRAGQARHSG